MENNTNAVGTPKKKRKALNVIGCIVVVIALLVVIGKVMSAVGSAKREKAEFEWTYSQFYEKAVVELQSKLHAAYSFKSYFPDKYAKQAAYEVLNADQGKFAHAQYDAAVAAKANLRIAAEETAILALESIVADSDIAKKIAQLAAMEDAPVFGGSATGELETAEQTEKETTAKVIEPTSAATKSVALLETPSQKNAIRMAKDYLDYSAFSRKGLIDQLVFEGFSNADAAYGADNCNADWMEQAVISAQEYLDYSAFSRQGLIDQLVFEGFTREQAVHGADSVGL